MPQITKYELIDVISGKDEVKFGKVIQTIANYLGRGQKTGALAEKSKRDKNEETADLRRWIRAHGFWYDKIDFSLFISEGAEQRVYLKDDTFVIKLNDSIYYECWQDYFHSLLLNNFFFPDTAYELLGFYADSDVLYAVVQQPFVKAKQPTRLEAVKEFLESNGFVNTRNHDYHHPELQIILEDLHDENVLTQDGFLYFIDTVFYLKPGFFNF